MQGNPVKKRLQKLPRNINPLLNWTLGTLYCTLYTTYEGTKKPPIARLIEIPQ
jgi:hypothetical protein